jgi:hypothetical protein
VRPAGRGGSIGYPGRAPVYLTGWAERDRRPARNGLGPCAHGFLECSNRNLELLRSRICHLPSRLGPISVERRAAGRGF